MNANDFGPVSQAAADVVIGALDGDAVIAGEGAVLLDAGSDATITGTDDLAGTALIVSLGDTGQTGDVVSLLANDSVTLDGSNILVDGAVVGQFAGGTDGDNLTISFGPDAVTAAQAQAVVRALSFAADPAASDDADRTVSVSFFDDEGTSDTADVVVTFDEDGAPMLADLPDEVTVPGEGITIIDLGEAALSDAAEADEVIQLVVEAAIGALSAVASDGVTVTATDPSRVVISGTQDQINAFLMADRLVYDPDPDLGDVDVLTISLDDGDPDTPPVELGEVTINVETMEVVDADAQNDAFAVAVDGTLGDGASLFADNGDGEDTPPTDGTLAITAVNGEAANVGTQITLDSGALLTVNADGTFSYDPNDAFVLAEGETAIETFTYEVNDGDTATVTIAVGGEAEGDPADAQDDAFTIAADGTLGDGASLFADNGSGADTGPDGEALAITAVNGEAASVGEQIALDSGALLTVNADGTFSYDPNGAFDDLAEGETATETFSYTVNDDDEATVTITIEADEPSDGIANDDAFALDADATIGDGLSLFGANGGDADVAADDGALVISAVNGSDANVGTTITLASGALLTVNEDGTFSYDPNGAFDDLPTGETTTDSFTYTVNDNDEATVTFTIAGQAEETADELEQLDALQISQFGRIDLRLEDLELEDGGQDVTVVLSVGNGTLSASDPSLSIEGSGTGELTLTGTPAEITAFLVSSYRVLYESENPIDDDTLSVSIGGEEFATADLKGNSGFVGEVDPLGPDFDAIFGFRLPSTDRQASLDQDFNLEFEIGDGDTSVTVSTVVAGLDPATERAIERMLGETGILDDLQII